MLKKGTCFAHPSVDHRGQQLSESSARLLLVDLNHIVLLHLQSLGGLVVVESAPVKQEPGYFAPIFIGK